MWRLDARGCGPQLSLELRQCGFEHGEASPGSPRSDQRVAERGAVPVCLSVSVFRGCAQCFAKMTNRCRYISCLTRRNAQRLIGITANLP